MERNGVLFPKFGVKGSKIGKIDGSEQTPKSARGCLWLTIPEPRGNGRQDSGDISQHITSQQGEFRQTETGQVSKDELTMETNHLFGGQRRLLHRPAFFVDEVNILGRDSQVSSQNKWVFVGWIEKDVNGQGEGIGVHFCGTADQLAPGMHLDCTLCIGKDAGLVRLGGWNCIAAMGAGQRSDGLAVFGPTPVFVNIKSRRMIFKNRGVWVDCKRK